MSKSEYVSILKDLYVGHKDFVKKYSDMIYMATNENECVRIMATARLASDELGGV